MPVFYTLTIFISIVRTAFHTIYLLSDILFALFLSLYVSGKQNGRNECLAFAVCLLGSYLCACLVFVSFLTASDAVNYILH